MATRERFSRKKLKEPDQFISTSDRFLHFCDENQTALIAVFVGVVVVLGSFWGIRYNNQVQELRMEKLLFEMKTLQKENADKSPSETIPKVEAMLEEFKNGRQKNRAVLLLADLYFQNKQFDKSLEKYSDVLQNSKENDLNHTLSRIGVAYSHEGAKDYDSAIEVFKSIIDQNNDFLAFDVYLGLARCYELKNDSKNALLILREMQTKFPGHVDIEKVNRQIARLEKTV